jgi:type IV secretion system protein VirB10
VTKPHSNAAAEALKLRSPPKPIVRLSRRALIVLGGAGAVTLGGALIFALQSPHINAGKAALPDYSVQNRPVSDRFNSLPSDYAQTLPPPKSVPQLGPPLPGDLGKPILDAQGGAVAPARASALASPMDGTSKPSINAAAPSAGSATPQDQVRDAARQSHLFTQVGKSDDASLPAAQALPGANALVALGDPAETSKPETSTPESRQVAFLNQGADRLTTSPERLQAPSSPYLILAGNVISAALITGLRSDLPGQVTAQVSQNVYDSLTGRYLLIPQGSRLIGQYDTSIAFGQRRVLLAWTRLILPNGMSLILDRASAADAQGLAGLSDQTDYHGSGVLQAAALSTVLSLGAQAGSSEKDSDIVQALRSGVADSFSRTGQQVVERQLNIQPTLTIRPGFPVRVILSRDLVLEPYGG